MPANLTPQYHKAEQAYKEARTVEEKVAALEEMLAVIPKHKGTDHLQGDLKRRLAKLREEASRPKAKAAFNPFRVERGGAGQVVVVGAPNAGKSAVVAATTKAQTSPTPFPFATQGPIPGMIVFEDVQVQLVDLPPITRDYFPAGMLGLIKSADAVLVVADLGADSVLDDLEACLDALKEGRVCLHDPALAAPGPVAPDSRDVEPGAAPMPERELHLPARLLASKVDLPGARERLEILADLYGDRLPPVAVSTTTGEGLAALPAQVFALLDKIRVYSKLPGKPPDRTSPFALKRGSTILDLAAAIHRDFPENLRQAKVWGSARFDGQAVERTYVLCDGDVVELQVDL